MTFFGPDIRNGLPIGLGSVAGFGRRAFTPSVLFAAGEQGFWYDPSDLSSMYQESTGVTPVTAVEQAVGLILDKSKGLVLGPELVTNGNFSNGTTGWTITGAWAESGGQFVKTGGSTATASQAILTIGKTYRITVDVVAVSTGVLIYAGSGNAQTVTTPGTKTFTVVCLGDTSLYVQCLTAATATIDNISVRELAGNHAIQPGATNRPILRSRYNLLLNTGFAGAAPGTPGTAPTSWAFGSATGSISAVNGDQLSFSTTAQRIFIQQSVSFAANSTYRATFTIHANSGVFLAQLFTWSQSISGASETLFVNGVIRNPITYVPVAGDQIDFRLTLGATAGSASVRFGLGCSDVSTATATTSRPDIRLLVDNYLPAYQRVTSATDYDTVGFPVYLAFDGSDDSLYTGGSIDFSATDKMTVWAGVTKLSDAAFGAIAELTANAVSNNGGFYLVAGGGAGSVGALYGGAINGSASYAADFQTFAAPITNALTQQMDIALAAGADELTLRADGVAATRGTTSGTNAGTGNFANAPLYIGRRNNATLPFNGRLYQLIGRGAATSAAIITQAERWVAGKQGRAL